VTINPSSLSPFAGTFSLLTPNRLTQERAWQVAYSQLTAVLTKKYVLIYFLPLFKFSNLNSTQKEEKQILIIYKIST
jgi:hypothetical protein